MTADDAAAGVPYEVVERVMSFRVRRARIELSCHAARIIAEIAGWYGVTIHAFLEAQVMPWLEEAQRQEAYVEAFATLAKRLAQGAPT